MTTQTSNPVSLSKLLLLSLALHLANGQGACPSPLTAASAKPEIAVSPSCPDGETVPETPYVFADRIN